MPTDPTTATEDIPVGCRVLVRPLYSEDYDGTVTAKAEGGYYLVSQRWLCWFLPGRWYARNRLYRIMEAQK